MHSQHYEAASSFACSSYKNPLRPACLTAPCQAADKALHPRLSLLSITMTLYTMLWCGADQKLLCLRTSSQAGVVGGAAAAMDAP